MCMSVLPVYMLCALYALRAQRGYMGMSFPGPGSQAVVKHHIAAGN